MSVPLKDIQFGFTSAEVEAAEAPELLLGGFFDAYGVTAKLLAGREHLLLGQKGSGKSSVALHLTLDASRRADRFVTTYILRDFSYERLRDIGGGSDELELRFPRAWSWLLLIAVFGSLVKDNGLRCDTPEVFDAAIRELRDTGLLPTSDLAALMTKSTLKSFDFRVLGTGIGGSRDTSRGDATVAAAAAHLRDVASSIRTDSRHLVVIDGLDEVLLMAGQQFTALSALIAESARLNQHFSAHEVPVKIAILCRTDLYQRLPGPNQNKIRQDLSLELRWFQEAGTAVSSKLAQLATRRAHLSDPRIVDLFASYFPAKIGQRNTLKYLLDHTRYTPRDFLRLLTFIQRSAIEHAADEQSVRVGLRAYADDYFIPEVYDELDGFIARDGLNAFFDLLRHFGQARFQIEQLERFREGSAHAKNLNVRLFLQALYECGAVGYVQFGANNYQDYIFKHRAPTSSLNVQGDIIVHNVVSKALRLTYNPSFFARKAPPPANAC